MSVSAKRMLRSPSPGVPQRLQSTQPISRSPWRSTCMSELPQWRHVVGLSFIFSVTLGWLSSIASITSRKPWLTSNSAASLLQVSARLRNWRCASCVGGGLGELLTTQRMCPTFRRIPGHNQTAHPSAASAGARNQKPGFRDASHPRFRQERTTSVWPIHEASICLGNKPLCHQPQAPSLSGLGRDRLPLALTPILDGCLRSNCHRLPVRSSHNSAPT